jgi:hypothetical protein
VALKARGRRVTVGMSPASSRVFYEPFVEHSNMLPASSIVRVELVPPEAERRDVE